MNRATEIQKQFNLPTLQAIHVTETISQLIANEILGQAEIIEIEGDIYGMVPGLRKAAQIALRINENIQ